MTMKNVIITTGFALITASQLGVGLTMIILAAKMGGEVLLLWIREIVSQTRAPRQFNRSHSYPSTHTTYACLSSPAVWRSRLRVSPSFMVRANWLRPDLVHTICIPDFLAFSFIIFFTRKSKVKGLKVRTIWDTIAEDATRYFLVIFTAHFVFVMTLNLGRVSETILLMNH